MDIFRNIMGVKMVFQIWSELYGHFVAIIWEFFKMGVASFE